MCALDIILCLKRILFYFLFCFIYFETHTEHNNHQQMKMWKKKSGCVWHLVFVRNTPKTVWKSRIWKNRENRYFQLSNKQFDRESLSFLCFVLFFLHYFYPISLSQSTKIIRFNFDIRILLKCTFPTFSHWKFTVQLFFSAFSNRRKNKINNVETILFYFIAFSVLE